MDGTSTTSFLEELRSTDDIADIRGNGNYPPVPMEMQHQQQQYWQMGPGVPQGMRQPQYGQYGSMNKPVLSDMMSPRPGQVHGAYSSYSQGGQMMNPNAMYGYGNQQQTSTNITPPRMGSGPPLNPMWGHQSPGSSDKPPYPGHTNLASPQQHPIRLGGGMYPQGNMTYGDASGIVPQQRMHNYSQMQGNIQQHGMMSPRGIPPQMIPGGRMQGSSGQYMYPQGADQPSRNENMQINQGQPTPQGSAGGQFHSQNSGGMHSQQLGDPSSMQQPQQQQSGGHHQMAMNVSGQYQMSGGMMGGQYGGSGGMYRMQGYPPSNQQTLMMSPGAPQQGMKGYPGQVPYGHNQGYWPSRQMNPHFQGDMNYQNQGAPAYNMPHPQMHQQQYLQTQPQQKHLPAQPPPPPQQQQQQQQQLQHPHPPTQQLPQTPQQMQQSSQQLQQSNQQIGQSQQFQQHPQQQPQQHPSEMISPQLSASHANVHHQQPQQQFSHQQYTPSYQQQQLISPHLPQQQQFHSQPQQKSQVSQFQSDQPRLHSPAPSINAQPPQHPSSQLSAMNESQPPKFSQQLETEEQQPPSENPQTSQSVPLQNSTTPPQQQRMRFIQQQQMQQSPSLAGPQYSGQQALQVKISSPSTMDMPKLTSENPSRPASSQAPQTLQLSPYPYRQQTPQQSQQQQQMQHHQQQQYHLPHMEADPMHGSFNRAPSASSLMTPSGELVSPTAEDLMPVGSNPAVNSSNLVQLGNVEDDEATLSTPPPPLLRSCVDFDSDMYMSGQPLPYPPAPQPQMHQLHFPPPDDPFQPAALERVTPGMMSVGPSMQQLLHQQQQKQADPNAGASNRKKRKSSNEVDGESKPKRPRKSKKKKESEDSIENVPTSSLEPDLIGGVSGYSLGNEGLDAFSSDSSAVKLKKSKKSKGANMDETSGKRTKTPKKSKTAEELEASRMMKLQVSSGEKKTKKKSDKKSKLMEGVNEVSSTVETSDPILGYQPGAADAANVVGTSAADEPASFSEPSSDNAGVANTLVKEVKPKVTVKQKSKKKKPLPTMFKSKKRKRAPYSGSDVEKNSTKDFSDDDNINKRRSGRNTKRLKYMCDQDLSISEEDTVDAVAANNNAVVFEEFRADVDSQVVDKVLGSKIVKRKVLREKSKVEGIEEGNEGLGTCGDGKMESDKADMENKDGGDDEEEVEMFYVKFKNFSYLHCEWKMVEEMEQGDKRILQKIKRFKIKQQNSFFEQVDEDDYFNPDYVEVDRVLDLSVVTDPLTNEETTHYLVKWRALPYEESTWELAQDVDKQKTEAFLRFKDLPPEPERQFKARPCHDEWKEHAECPFYKNGNTLREYQLVGLNWLTFRYFNKNSCILADEMGLGKTIQSITFIEDVSRYGIRGPFLIIVPLSTIANWQREFEAWTDLNVIVYHGSNASRNMLQQYEIYYRDSKGKKISNVYKFNALITTFEVIISDLDILKQVEWRIAVIDEAHRLKNRNCKLLQGLSSIDIEHRLLLTGTPLQNNVEELFSLLSFLEPKQFVSPEAFMLEFGKLETETQVEKLQSLLKPVMLRRLKEDVEKSLAPKEETIIEVELTNVQKKYYRAIFERNFAFLARGGSFASVPTLMNTMMELRKCCNHPFLINGAEDAILEEFNVTHAPQDGERLFHTMVQASGKLVLTDKLLPKLKADGHKVLIFSQMIRVLDVLEDYLIYKKYLYERIDGRIRGSLRQEAIDRFCKPDSDRFIFLLCTRAGGLGINLTAADTVIIYDSDWNPQNDLQAQARCHRIGQQKSVKVYRLITRNTYEREMFDRASLKLGLDKAVLQSMGSKDLNSSNQLSKKEIEDLLKKGAYGALMDDDNSTGNDFCEEDIDHILQRRTQIVQVQAGVKGSTFAKASFSLSTNRLDIDVADPQFWQKWAKKADVDADQLLSAADSKDKNALIIEMPRQRRQVSRYGKQDEPVHMSDLESSGSEDEDNRGCGKGAANRKGRKGDAGADDATDENAEEDESQPKLKYTRNECYNVEKCILVFGWGRWNKILEHGRFKRKLNEEDVRNVTRAILLYSLKHYDGDDKIKMFIYDLISPSEDGMEINCQNHSGLSAPVPRGRKGRRGSSKKVVESPVKKFDGDLKKIDLDLDRFISDPSYKKHLKRHANRVLLRVRLLFYLKHTIIGQQADKIMSGAHSSEVDIMVPRIDSDLPCYWWDIECDKCMLIGVFKHGYERYAQMRLDPSLCFLGRCGPPPNDVTSSITDIDEHDDDEEMRDDDDDDEEDTDSMQKPKKRSRNQPQKREQPQFEPSEPSTAAVAGQLPFPSVSDLNQRLRRIITAFQKIYKKELMRQEQREKRMQKREQFDQIMKEREIARKAALQNRWSRREEAEFYRLVSSFGVERDPNTLEFKWNRFRSMGHLDRKFDETLTEYYKAFIAMCNKVCKRSSKDNGVSLVGAASNEAAFTGDLVVEHITEERASRCLARIELLCRIRERILTHSDLDLRLSLCQTSSDLPEWWIPGKHDKDLLIGAAKHGLTHMEATILCDPELSFCKLEKEVVRSNVKDAAEVDSKDIVCPENESQVRHESPSKEVDSNMKEASRDTPGDENNLCAAKREDRACADDKGANDGGRVSEERAVDVIDAAEVKMTDSNLDAEDGESKDDKAIDDQDVVEAAAEEDAIKDVACEEDAVSARPSCDDDNTVSEISIPVGNEMTDGSKTPVAEETQNEFLEENKDVPEIRCDPARNVDACKTTSEGFSETCEEKQYEEVLERKMEEDPEKPVADEGSSHTLSADDIDKMDDVDDKLNETDANAENTKDMPVLEPAVEDETLLKGNIITPICRTSTADRRRSKKFTDIKSELNESATGEHTENNTLKFPEIYLPHWPKDRILIHRLENVCNCIERGEWPSVHKFLANIGSSVNMMLGSCTSGLAAVGMGSSFGGGQDSHCSTPTIPDTPTTGGCATPILGLDLSYSSIPNAERISEALDGSIPKRRHRRTKAEMEADRISRLRNYLAASRSGTPVDPAASRLSLSDVLVSRRLLTGSGGKDEDSGTSSTEIMKDVDMMRVFKRRRGRKSKIDKMLEAAAIEAMVRGGTSHPDALLASTGASSLYADWTKMLGQSPSTTPQPPSTLGKDGTGKLTLDEKFDEKDSIKFSVENLSSDCMPLALTSTALAATPSAASDAMSSSSSSQLNPLMSLSAVLLKAPPSQSSDDDGEHSIISRMMLGQQSSRQQHHSSSYAQSFNKSSGAKVSDLLQQRDTLKIMEDQAMEERIQSELEMVVSQRQKRRSRLDPSKIDVDSMDGSENVSVVDRTTGKKITGAKAPPIKHLQEWLLRNPTYDVDPKWSHIVKVNLPAELHSRVLTPSGRGRKSTLPQSGTQAASSSLSSSSAAAGYPSSPFAGLGLLSSSTTTSTTSVTSSTDYYNSMASFMAAASASPSGSFMGLSNPFSPPLGALANSMYAASLAASMGLLPPIPGGAFGLDDLAVMSGGSIKEEKKEQQSSKKKATGDKDESKSKAEDLQRKKTSKSSSSSLTPAEMDMSSLFGPSSFTPFMYNQLLLSQLYAQSLAAFNQIPGATGFQSPTPFLSSFMPPPLPFDATLPSTSTSSSSSGKHGTKQSQQEDKKRSEGSHRSSGKSSRESGGASSGSGKSSSTSRKPSEDLGKIPKPYCDASLPPIEKSKAHSSSKHSPLSSHMDSKKHSMMEDIFASSLMPPPMLDMFGPSNSLLTSPLLSAGGHADDEPEDLSVPSKKKSGNAKTESSMSSIDKDPFGLSFKPPSLSNSRYPDDKSFGSIPFFMDPLVTPSAMSFLSPSMAFPDLNLSMKSPFEPVGLPPKRDEAKSSKKDSSSGGGSGKSSSKKKESSSYPDSDPHSLMPQFMAQDFARYNFMDEQLRMMAPMDIPPFYLPSFPGFPALYPDLGASFGNKKSSPERSKDKLLRKQQEGSSGCHGSKDERKERSLKKNQDPHDGKMDFESASCISRRLFSPDLPGSNGGKTPSSAFNIDQLSIPAIPSDPSLFFPPPPPPFSFTLSEPREKSEPQLLPGVEERGNVSSTPNKNLTPKSRSKFGLIDSIGSKLLARKQLVEQTSEGMEEDKDAAPSRSKSFEYAAPTLFPRAAPPLFDRQPDYPPSAPQSGPAGPEEEEEEEEGGEEEVNPKEATEDASKASHKNSSSSGEMNLE